MSRKLNEGISSLWGRNTEEKKYIIYSLFTVLIMLFSFLFGYGMESDNIVILSIGFLGIILSIGMLLYLEETLTDWRKGETGFSGWDYIVLTLVLIILVIIIIIDLKSIVLF
jgi:hypothetical protein